MPNIRLLNKDEIERLFAPMSKRALREQEMMPYREAVSQLSSANPGGIIELELDENPRIVMMRLHRAARDLNKNIRFQRHGRDQRELRFRLQSPEETERLKDRGRKLAQARRAKRSG
ncbi:MAG TPA: hypothetical protein VHL09_04495 [Dehalococcoidia bacterium]|nr:hypothetical protein [Dehalococcoidia bacterium]